KNVAAIDLSGGQTYLEPDWGLRSVCDWARLKFQIKVAVEDLTDKEPDEIKRLLHSKVLDLYHQKEAEFPVKVAMARFMADRQHVPGGQRYDREGLYHWTRQRFPGISDSLIEEEFRTQSRARIQEDVLKVSRSYSPKTGQDQIDQKLGQAFEGAT